MKKFWEKVSIKKISSDSFCIMLDDRILKTPLKRELILPKLNLAQEIVKEWDQDSKKINTESMIFYGLISTSLDKIIDNKNSTSQNLTPEIRVYNKPETITYEASINTRLFSDSYLTMSNISSTDVFNIKFQKKPFMNFIWFSVLVFLYSMDI